MRESRSAGRPSRMAIAVATVALLVASGTLTNSSVVTANRVPYEYSITGQLCYYIDPSFTASTSTFGGFSVAALNAAFQAWRVDGINARVDFVNCQDPDNSMHVRAVNCIGGGHYATATLGCSGSTAASCLLTFNRSHPWWTATSVPTNASYVDFRTVALHEIGHLVGVDHTNNTLQSDVNGGWFTDVGATGAITPGLIRRTVHTDDMQAARIARPDNAQYKNIVINTSLEQPIAFGTHPAYGTSRLTGWSFFNGGLAGAQRSLGTSGAYSGSYFLRFTSGAGGSSTSIYQDVFFEPFTTYTNPTYMRDRPLSAGTYARGRAGDLVIWWLDTGYFVELPYPASSTWKPRVLINSVPAYGNLRYRLQVYDHGPTSGSGNVDLDLLSLTFV